MEDREIKEALWKVATAVDRVNKVFEGHLKDLKESGGDPARVRQVEEAVRSMRDSGTMYLAWAYHYADVPFSENESTP